MQGNLLKGIVIWFVRREGIEPNFQHDAKKKKLGSILFCVKIG